MKEKNIVTGYKVFCPDWTCNPTYNNPKQYSCPGIFEEDVTPSVGKRGIHFCKELSDCFNYHPFNPDNKNKVAKVIALGEIDEEAGGSKCCTNKLQIVEEISWEDVLRIVNLGKENTGLSNSGNNNSGNRNSGDCNSGNQNSGDCNSGNRNSGDYNSGDCDSGDHNSGYNNSGDRNSGNNNSGNRNSGNCNSGDHNKGYRNSGDWNSGDFNSGNHNSGNHNSGEWNTTDHSNGCFNTEEPKIFLFNKPSNWTYRDWLNSDARYLLNRIPRDADDWIWSDTMTDEEKEQHPDYEVVGGYLKSLDESECRQSWWNSLSEKDKDTIKAIPNFDEEIFEKCTGIKIQV